MTGMEHGRGGGTPGGRTPLDLAHVLETLSVWTGIPAERLTTGRIGAERLEGLAQALGSRIFGQEKAIEAAVHAIQRRYQLPEAEGARRPIWTAVFAGGSGVGKTELGRSLALDFCGDAQKHLVKIDLGELREEHTVSRLVGSPPGYVGHGQGGELTNALRKCSTGVLLLDEIEKAHPAILTTVVLPMVGEAIVHDMNDGRTYDVSSWIVVMTTNLGTNRPHDRIPGFVQGDAAAPEGKAASAVRAAIRAYFPKEVLGRIDDVIVFEPLSDEVVERIWRREMESLEARLAAQGRRARVRMAPAAEAILLGEIRPSVEREGARAVQRIFRRAVEDRCLDLLAQIGPADESFEIRIEPTNEGGLRYWIEDGDSDQVVPSE